MRIILCEWDEWNVSHVGEHGVEFFEVEEVFESRPFLRKIKDGKHIAYGQARSGRYLTVIFAYRGRNRAYPITARDSTWKERNYAQNQKKK